MMGLSGWAASVMSVASDVAASALSHRCIASAVDLRAVMSVITPTCGSNFLLLNTSACFQPASGQKRVQLKKSVKSWLGYITEIQNRQKHSHIEELFHFLREALAQNAQQAKLQMNRP